MSTGERIREIGPLCVRLVTRSSPNLALYRSTKGSMIRRSRSNVIILAAARPSPRYPTLSGTRESTLGRNLINVINEGKALLRDPILSSIKTLIIPSGGGRCLSANSVGKMTPKITSTSLP